MRHTSTIALCAAGLLAGFLICIMTWLNGFDTGAAAMQCIDAHAIIGQEQAMATDACQEAAERGKRPTAKAALAVRSAWRGAE